MKIKQRGLTPLESIIVLAIFAVFAWISIPAYQNHIIRSRVMDALSLGTTAQFAVSKVANSLGRLPRNQAETGYTAPNKTAIVDAISIANDGSGVITIQTSVLAGGGTIELEPDFEVGYPLEWDCSGGTLGEGYRPVECR